MDRAILEGETEGTVRIHRKKWTDRIIGATIVAAGAGDMISEITLAMTHGLGLEEIADTIHPYPTQAEAVRKVADLYNRFRPTPFVKKSCSRNGLLGPVKRRRNRRSQSMTATALPGPGGGAISANGGSAPPNASIAARTLVCDQHQCVDTGIIPGRSGILVHGLEAEDVSFRLDVNRT